MSKSIILKILIALVLIVTCYSGFWFFKTNAVRKGVLSAISSSGGKVSASLVSVSGFPLKQKLTIKDLKFELSSLPSSSHIFIQGQVDIKLFQAVSSIFNGNFEVVKLGDISFKGDDNNVSRMDFKKTPEIKFIIDSQALRSLSYKDSGYKVVDIGQNILFENGSSDIQFSSMVGKDQSTYKVKASFKDINAFNVVYSNSTQEEKLAPKEEIVGVDELETVNDKVVKNESTKDILGANKVKEKSEEKNIDAASQDTKDGVVSIENKEIIKEKVVAKSIDEETKKLALDQDISKNKSEVTKDLVESKTAQAILPEDIKVINVDSKEVPIAKNKSKKEEPFLKGPFKKSFLADIEYVMSRRDQKIIVDPNSPIKINDLATGSQLSSITINNFEVSTPLSVISMSGNISSFPKDDFPLGKISVKITNLDNLVKYLFDILSEKIGVENPRNFAIISSDSEEVIDSKAVAMEVEEGAVSVNQDQEESLPKEHLDKDREVEALEQEIEEKDIKYTQLIAAQTLFKEVQDHMVRTFKDLSKKNKSTNASLAVFDFKQELKKELAVNESPISSVIMQIIGGGFSNEGGDDNPAATEQLLDSQGSVKADNLVIDEDKEIITPKVEPDPNLQPKE